MLDYDEKERELLKALRKHLYNKYDTNYYFVKTGKTYAALDGIAVKQTGDKMFEIAAVYESKCRHLDLKSLKTFEPINTVVITYDKLMSGVAASKELSVPFYCLTYFLEEKPTKGMLIEVTNENADIIADIHITRESNPRSKSNPSKKVVRTNAYISIDTAEIFEVETND